MLFKLICFYDKFPRKNGSFRFIFDNAISAAVAKDIFRRVFMAKI